MTCNCSVIRCYRIRKLEYGGYISRFFFNNFFHYHETINDNEKEGKDKLLKHAPQPCADNFSLTGIDKITGSFADVIVCFYHLFPTLYNQRK